VVGSADELTGGDVGLEGGGVGFGVVDDCEGVGDVAGDVEVLVGSGRVVGLTRRFYGRLAKGGSDAVGAAAEAAEARVLVEGDELRDKSLVVVSAVKGQRLDLGNGLVFTLEDVDEADLVYVTRDGVIHLDEVKRQAGTFASKLQQKPAQFENMLEWRRQDPASRVVGVRIRTDQGWTGLFSQKLGAKLSVIQELAKADVPVMIGGRLLTPQQLRVLHRAVLAASKHPDHPVKPREWTEWYATYLPDFVAARRFLKRFGVDFL
jgi:hypothetical protein